MPRAFKDTLLSLGTVALVLLVLVSLDDRVREEFSSRILSHPTQHIADVGHDAETLTAVVARAARTQSIDHAPMLIFALAAAVLTVFMLRT
jgi:hypothetical protein